MKVGDRVKIGGPSLSGRSSGIGTFGVILTEFEGSPTLYEIATADPIDMGVVFEDTSLSLVPEDLVTGYGFGRVLKALRLARRHINGTTITGGELKVIDDILAGHPDMIGE